ncbi:uncharacterized protein LOC112055789 isoform X2 [Bicyclus anynana]|uniref:Uncharacterized protein LOC112055789 isoform X2 n=1 Tax=Bicyclus anynana TaxID=110368 RepID=A0ABM3LUZ0_BICAN|nr:uncharacterized protein LOC112055789 isoform X2 [Bicyclus anynana]
MLHISAISNPIQMDLQFPITLPGSNLREKHRYLNNFVNETYKRNLSFQEIAILPETSPIDRIFKIDLASKHRNVEYILDNLKRNDMLYVSRSLKCLWILDNQYSDIIKPSYLESTLYPEMIQPAVNKMKHFIWLNLKDKERCQIFYNYYRSNFEDAFNFFWHCSSEFIKSELPNIIDKLSYKQLKIVFEVCPSVSKLYFEILPNNQAALTKYTSNASKYFNCIKSVLKSDGNVFLDIVEKYFDSNSFDAFSSSITEYIMKNYRNRFDAKSELYVAYVLHMKTIAANMTGDQAKELVLKLARAEYLEYWFTYKKVEPLIKRLKSEERSSFKKQVFVDKAIDGKVKEWRYPLPKPLVLKIEDESHVFTDVQHEPYEYENHYLGAGMLKRRVMKKCAMSYECSYVMDCVETIPGKSPLDQLFNRYRFIGFEQTFYELNKNLLAESTIEGRLNMMLVLVSKSGGVPEQVEKFLKLMVERHKNEPTTLRAAVIRSLVKRGSAWRLPENVWSLVLQFGVDIGLDGAETDPTCREGLHAVVLRHLLADAQISPALLTGFLRQFSTFTEYKLNLEEKKLVAKRLPPLILSSDANAFLDTLVQYKVNLKEIPNAKTALLKAAKTDSNLVSRLYKARILRRELFIETFALKQHNAAYINALRHDTSPLKDGKSFAELITKERPNHDWFLKSLNIYFSESGGLAEKHRIALEEAFLLTPKYWFPRPLSSFLTNEELLRRISDFEVLKPQSKWQVVMSTGLRANAHFSKSPVVIDYLDWQWIGAKAIANKALICRKSDQERYIKKLLVWRRSARIAVRLSAETPWAAETFITFCSLRPLAALKVGLTLYLSKDDIQPSIWYAIKTIIQNKDLSQKQRLLRKLSDPKKISKNVVADYWVQVFNIYMKIDEKLAMPVLCTLENIQNDVDQQFMRGLVNKFIETELDPNTFSKDEDDYDSTNKKCMYVRIIAKHLLLCKSENEQSEVIDKVCDSFFDAIEVLMQKPEFKKNLIKLLKDFIFSLKFSKVFLSEQYANCMPVFEAILKRLHKILPMEEYFANYVEIHLTMLYYKSIKQAVKNKPGNFNEPKNRNEAIEIVGRIFGNYVGHEIKELVNKYFKSVIDLYKGPLNDYLRNYFHFNESREVLMTFVVKGLLKTNTTEAYILAEYIFQKEQQFHISQPHRDEILKILKNCKDDEVKMFLYADVLSIPCS